MKGNRLLMLFVFAVWALLLTWVYTEIAHTAEIKADFSETPYTSQDWAETELARFEFLVQQADDWLAITSDLSMRVIVCRVANFAMSITAMSNATGIPKETLLIAMRKLINRNLIKVSELRQDDVIIEAYNQKAEVQLKRYQKWCINEDAQCEIER
jgi:hypothetical protein